MSKAAYRLMTALAVAIVLVVVSQLSVSDTTRKTRISVSMACTDHPVEIGFASLGRYVNVESDDLFDEIRTHYLQTNPDEFYVSEYLSPGLLSVFRKWKRLNFYVLIVESPDGRIFACCSKVEDIDSSGVLPTRCPWESMSQAHWRQIREWPARSSAAPRDSRTAP